MATGLQALDAIAGTQAPAAPVKPLAPAASGLSALDSFSVTPPPPKAPAPAPAPAPAKPQGFLQNLEADVGGVVHGVEDFFTGKKAAPAPEPKNTGTLADLDAIAGTAAPVKQTSSTQGAGLSALDAAAGTTPPEKPLVQNTDHGNGDYAPIGSESNFNIADSTTPIGPEGSGDTISFLKDMAQGFAHDFASLGLTSDEAILKAQGATSKFLRSKGIPFAQDPDVYTNAAESATPSGFMSYLVGNQPVEDLAQTAAKYEAAIKGSPFAKKYGLDKLAMPLGVLGATTPIGIDFVGLGGEKVVLDALAATSDIARTADILRSIGVHGDLAMRFARDIAEMSDKTEIKGALDSIDALQKSTHAINPSGLTRPAEGDIVETATKGVAKATETKPLGEALKAPESAVPAVGEEVPAAAAKSTEAAADAATQGAKEVPRTLSQITTELADMKQQESFLKDALSEHPGKALSKFTSSATGELPEVSKNATSKFGKQGDKIVQDLLGQEESNGGDLDVAQAKLDEYIQLRQQTKDTSLYVKQLKAELSLAKTAEKEKVRLGRVQEKTRLELERARARIAESRARARINPDKAGSQSMGDYLRRGAERADVRGRERPTDGMVRGNASEQMQKYALDEANYGGIERGPFKGWSERMRNWFQDWIHHRQAVPVDVKIALSDFEQRVGKGEYADLLKRGRSAQDEYLGDVDSGVAPNREKPVYQALQQLYEKMFQEEKSAGIPVHERDQYGPLYFNYADPESGEMLPGRRVGLKPGFTQTRDYKDYIQAENASEGKLQPLNKNIVEDLRMRLQAHYKAMADADMFRSGTENGWIIPKTAVLDKYKGEFRDLSSERFPSIKTAFGNSIYSGVWTAPEGVAEKFNNYLEDPRGFGKFMQKAGSVGGVLKNTALSVGIPGTGLSVHFWNVLPREVAIDFALSPLKAPIETARYFWYAVNPRAATRFINANLKEALPLIKAGMKVTTEDHSVQSVFSDVFKSASKSTNATLGEKTVAKAKQVSDLLHSVFAGNTFGKLLPARKIGNGIKLMKVYMAHGMSAADAARAAADDMNVVYGGINWEALGRDRNLQSFMRAALMAPDYAETNVRMGARGIGSLFKGGIRAKIYRSMMGFVAGSYAVANLVNYENTGHWMYQNDILHQFSIDLGKDQNGKEMYFNVYGTGVDFVRLPLYAATAIATGRFDQLNSIIRNRLSIPFASVFSLVENVDWKGDPIFGAGKFGQPQSAGTQAENVFANTLGNALPGSGQDLGAILSGQKSNVVGGASAFGLPISEKSQTPSVADINALKAKAAAAIKNGDYRLFNSLVKAGAITPRSKAAFIRDALRGKTQKQLNAAAKTKAKTTKVKQNIQDMRLIGP